MTDTKHTPGPWACEPMVGDTDAIWIGNADGYVAQITREDGLEACDWADARLIAAAPDLLAALREIERWTRKGPSSDTKADIARGKRHAHEIAARAIAAATGEDI